MNGRGALLAAALVVGCDARPAVPSADSSLQSRISVDPLDPGPAELPGDVLSEPFPWPAVTAGGVVAAGALAWLVGRRLSRRPAASPASAATVLAVVTPGPHERALRRIERLREEEPREPSQLEAFYVEASSLVRDYVGARFDLETSQMTTEQCLASSRGKVEPVRHGVLASILHECDGVKFARRSPSDGERRRLLDSAVSFIQETTPAVPESAT